MDTSGIEHGAEFETTWNRWGTNAIAADGFRDYLLDDYPDLQLPCADEDAIAMWVADMAFATPPEVVDAMRARLEHPIFGYTALIDDDFYRAYADWCVARYDWKPEEEHVFTTPGVVPALFSLVDYFIAPGQKVLTLTPAYGFFKTPVEDRDHTFVSCPLRPDGSGGYQIDFDRFEQLVADPALRMFFLCHPHNPTGRVWTEPELRRLTELCLANDVIVVSDEIHCDLLRTGVTHTPLAKLFPDEELLITCMSASKTFNLAGLGLSQIVIPGAELREIWSDRDSPVVNPISVAGTAAALRHGEPWRKRLLHYLDGNFAAMADVIARELPEAMFTIPDATYLGWIDLTRYFGPEIDLTRHFAETAGVLVEGGELFISDGDGHIRVNVACPRAVLEEGLARIVAATTS